MSLQADLQSAGWNLSQEGIDLCCKGLNNPTVKDVTKKALNLDFKEVGSPSLPEDINRGRVESLAGELVLMVTKVRNVAAPKVKEESGAAPRMLKISLTDGTTTCHAVEMSDLKSVSLKTLPGTKIKLKGAKLEVANGFVKISEKNLEVLGGEVEALIEKWKVSESLAEFTRSGMTGNSGEGPPKWLPFGQKNKMPKQDPNNKNFKSIAAKPSEGGEEGGEFECKRQEAVQEAAKGEQKKFAAGSSKNIKDSRAKREEERYRREDREKSDSQEKSDLFARDAEAGERGGRGGGRGGRGRGRGRREREEVDTGSAAPSKPSLFDFLQGQIPTPSTSSSASVPASAGPGREERKDPERSKPRAEFSTKYESRGRGEREIENKDFKPRKDQDRQKSGKESSVRKDTNTNQDRKSHPGDKIKDESRRKENNFDSSERKNNKKETKNSNSRNSNHLSKDFNPIFHGKSNGDDQPDKLDKYERSLFSDDLGSKTKSMKQSNSSSRNSARPHQQTDLTNYHSKQSSHNSNYNNYPPARGRNCAGNDQDFGQWNGSRNPADDLSAGFQDMALGPQRGGYQAQGNRGYRNGHHAPDRQSGGRGGGGQGGHQRHHDQRPHSGNYDKRGGYGAGPRQNWQEGQKCLAKYWEDAQYYTATITGLSPTTAVVHFEAYGNYEEVVLSDLLSLPNKNIAGNPQGLPPALRH